VKLPIVKRWVGAAFLFSAVIALLACSEVFRAADPVVVAGPKEGVLTWPAPEVWTAVAAAAPAETVEIQEFTRRVADGRPGSISGLYAPGVLALRVVQQPAGDSSFISVEGGTATEFQAADQVGSIGLLAHNTLAGADFYRLSRGDQLVLIYGDGRARRFKISQIADYQRLALSDLRSDFWSLDTQTQQTASEVFDQYYRQPDRLTLQTCLARDGVNDWGVHFVVADPAETSPNPMP
jgi:hypothetical protein